MEKQTSHKLKSNSIFKLIPKAAQAAAAGAKVLYQNPPFSPGMEKRALAGKALSGPIFSMIPAEARGRSKNNNFETAEPTSPKVSCIGQVRHRNSMSGKTVRGPKPVEGAVKSGTAESLAPSLKKKPSGIKRIFGSRRKSDACIDHCKAPLTDRPAPVLGQMRRFASSRETLANFDWTAAESGGGCCTDGEVEVVIPFSGRILVAQPRQEINLWKRRTMAQPKPLQLNLIREQ